MGSDLGSRQIAALEQRVSGIEREFEQRIAALEAARVAAVQAARIMTVEAARGKDDGIASSRDEPPSIQAQRNQLFGILTHAIVQIEELRRSVMRVGSTEEPQLGPLCRALYIMRAEIPQD